VSDPLLASVQDYAALGDHRSGTPVDVATTQWLAGHWPQRRIIRRLEIDGDPPYHEPNGG